MSIELLIKFFKPFPKENKNLLINCENIVNKKCLRQIYEPSLTVSTHTPKALFFGFYANCAL